MENNTTVKNRKGWHGDSEGHKRAGSLGGKASARNRQQRKVNAEKEQKQHGK